MAPKESSALVTRSSQVVPPDELEEFLETFLYDAPAVLIDEIRLLDPLERRIDAVLDTHRPLPFARAQRVSANHPAHVSGAELIMTTGILGCLHAYFIHGCKWNEGWAGFGNRIHRADFKQLALLGPPIELSSQETRTRVSEKRVVLRYTFEFRQNDRLVYVGDQSAMFVKGKKLG